MSRTDLPQSPVQVRFPGEPMEVRVRSSLSVSHPVELTDSDKPPLPSSRQLQWLPGDLGEHPPLEGLGLEWLNRPEV